MYSSRLHGRIRRSGISALWVIAGLVLIADATDARAIIMRHDRSDAMYRDLGETYRPYLVQLGLPDQQGVPRLYGGMGTLVAPTWVLTAGHVADRFTAASAYPVDRSNHHVWVMGRGYRVKTVHLHPRYERGEPEHDIALLELEVAPTSARVACLYGAEDERQREVINVGAGVPGNGLTGVGEPDGALRAGTALVERVERTVLVWRFRAPGEEGVTDLHGISGPGDSGGPALIVRGDQVCVAGVSGSQRRPDARPAGTYGVEEVYARVSAFRPWIQETIALSPEGAH